MVRFRGPSSVAVALLALSAASASAATFDVTRFDDPPGAGSVGDLSLRQAVLLANADPDPDTITLHAGTYRLTIRGDDATAAAGDLDINSNVTIQGDAGGGTVIDARKAKDRAFEVLTGATLTLTNVTVKGGSASGDGGAILNVEGSLALSDCTITGNKAHVSGGGISSESGTCVLTNVTIASNRAVTNDGGGCEFLGGGSATLAKCRILNNYAKDTGGGIDQTDDTTISLTACTVAGNRTTREGGGLDLEIGHVSVVGCTISGNRAAAGAGIQIEGNGQLSMQNATLTGNVGKKGGALEMESGASVTLDFVTIAGNKAKTGGGISNDPGTSLLLTATIVARNKPFDIAGTVESEGSNLIGRVDGVTIDGDTTGNLTGGPKPGKPLDPRLGKLAMNGGLTPTMALLPGSPAIDAVVGTCSATEDQRALARAGTCDIGAFEVQ
jgi:hypothetical protein